MEDKNSTELTWQEYEAITKYIYEMLGAQFGIKVKGYGRNCKVQGKSGVMHQVDVLTEQSDGERRYLTAIECKYLKTKVTKDTVMKLEKVMEDAGIDSGIIVCKMGFTRDTLTYAEHQGIRLVELREVDKDNHKGEQTINWGTLDINIQATITRPMIISIDLGSIQITDEQEIMTLRFPGSAFILTPEGAHIPFDKFVNAYCIELRNKDQLLKTITMACPPVNGKLIRNYSNAEVEIEKMVFSGFLAEIDASSKQSFQLVDQIWMIMKEIFEKNSYWLSKGGLLFKGTGES